jgi:hypothetical protein
MSDPYADLESIWARALAGNREHTARDVIAVLTKEGIRLRQKDGTLAQVTLSKPTSDHESRVVRSGRGIDSYYRGTLERELPEYQGTHKLQVDVTLVDGGEEVLPTWTNTITVRPPDPA